MGARYAHKGVEVVGSCTYAASVVAFPMILKICLSMLASEDLSPFVKSFWPSVNRGHRGQTQREGIEEYMPCKDGLASP
jgi:hypothetical protein